MSIIATSPSWKAVRARDVAVAVDRSLEELLRLDIFELDGQLASLEIV